MTIRPGTDTRGWVDEFDLSGHVTALSRLEQKVDQLDKTPLNKKAMLRIGGKVDGGLGWRSSFDDAVGASFTALLAQAGQVREPRIYTYAYGSTRGVPALTCQANQGTAALVRDAQADLNIEISADGSGYGVESGVMLTADAEQSTGAENLTGVTDGAAADTDFGAQFYLHVFSFTGTSCTVTVQDSDDDAATDPYTAVTGGAFTAVTAAGWQRIQTSRTENIKQYLRLALTGTYTEITLAVIAAINRNGTVNF